MTIQEKLRISSDPQKLTLFKEGMFYKCYNEDAMVFTQHIKAYKLSLKFVKVVGAKVVSIGFPIAKEASEASSMNAIARQLGTSVYVDSGAFVQLNFVGNFKSGYDKWLFDVDLEQGTNSAMLSEPGNLLSTELIQRIIEFDLANSTPMQCINFIHLLKQKAKSREDVYGNI